MNKVIHHINQGVFEYYVNNAPATSEQKNDLRFEYVDLRHNQEKNKQGLYGQYIKW
jgi:hypothetical protein